MNLKNIIGILVIVQLVAIGAFGEIDISRIYRLCGCDAIRYTRAPDRVCGNLVFYDQCEFECVQSIYSENSTITTIPCAAGTKSPGRASISEPYPTNDNYMCNCEMKEYSVEPEPVCATASFFDACQYSCVAHRYLDVSVVPC